MESTSALLLFGLALVLGGALTQILTLRRERGLRLELSGLQEELRIEKSSQAQIIHTTKLASLGQMVAGVTHEINTPLGFVKSNVEVVGDLLDEHEQHLRGATQALDLIASADPATLAQARELLQKANATLAQRAALGDARALLGDALEGIGSITKLIQNLKGFARVDRDGMDLVDINDSVRSALAVASHQLGGDIKVATELGALPRVRCMPSQINQVLLNLVTNAAHAMPDGGRLRIATRALESGVEIIVADSGRGIPDDVLPKIFDPFFTTKPVGEGTGLGLSIVHKIVKAHGGTIHVRTQVGRGTAFTITLPPGERRPGAAATPAVAPATGPVPAGRAA